MPPDVMGVQRRPNRPASHCERAPEAGVTSCAVPKQYGNVVARRFAVARSWMPSPLKPPTAEAGSSPPQTGYHALQTAKAVCKRDTHGVGRLAVKCQDEFGDPKIIATNDCREGRLTPE